MERVWPQSAGETTPIGVAVIVVLACAIAACAVRGIRLAGRVMLVIEGFVPSKAHELHLKNYIYFAMGFSVFVEMLNIRAGKKKKARLEGAAP